MYGIMIIQAIGQGCIFALLKNQWWYVAPVGLVNGGYNVKGVETATVLHILDIFFNAAATAFVISTPWKTRIWRNYLLTAWLLLTTVYNTVIIFLPGSAFGSLDLFNSYPDGKEYLTKLFILIYGISLILIIFEEMFVKKFVRNFERKRKTERLNFRRKSSIIRNESRKVEDS